LDGHDFVIGRAPSCDLVLPSDQLASRRHSQLEFDGLTYTIRDLGSSNGTYVNGEEIHQATPLTDGDKITVGEHELVFARTPARTTDGFPIPVPPPWPPAFNGKPGQPAGPTEKHAAVSSVSRETPPSAPGALPLPPQPTPLSASLPTARPATGAPSPGGDSGDIEHLHKLLVDASAGMVRRAEEAERQVAELRAMLADLQSQIGRALSTMAGELAVGGSAELEPEVALAAEQRLDELVSLAREAADNPRHLDHLSALAERAGDISDALEASRELARVLGAMSARLVEMDAEPEGDTQ
jgi:pSer/pThr/pTyr-binding forkhead associated (FHA) protein